MNTLSQLQHVMRGVFFDDTLVVSPQTTALDVAGWDSLSHSMLMLEIEAQFGVEIELDAAARCADVGELAALIDAAVAAH